jgi:hypothetical protein
MTETFESHHDVNGLDRYLVAKASAFSVYAC